MANLRYGRPQWADNLIKERFKNGRVLVVDYLHSNGQDRRKIAAQEFRDLAELQKTYDQRLHQSQTVLRVIHVQSATWATKFLENKFNIGFSGSMTFEGPPGPRVPDNDTNVFSSDPAGEAFGRWLRSNTPQRRGGKLVANGKMYHMQSDPVRGIWRTAFGLDYLKRYPHGRDDANAVEKVMDLDGFDASDVLVHKYDVFAQRLGVYIQTREELTQPLDLGNAQDRSQEERYETYQRLERLYGEGEETDERAATPPKRAQDPQTFDNGNTIIVFDNSPRAAVSDSLIRARQTIESRWRRLTFYLLRDDFASEDKMAKECMGLILKDIFNSLVLAWGRCLDSCAAHVDLLEDRIYESPTDEARAMELWATASLWLTVERLLNEHTDIIKQMRTQFREFTDDDSLSRWFDSTLSDFDKFARTVQVDLIRPTSALNDILYRSVAYRDSRVSLKLGISLWRLSWITFVFLPLTFIVGFFGMNVDTFEHFPSIKYYFIAAVCLMVIVLMLWCCVKHSLGRQHQHRQRRGAYELFNHDIAATYPRLWSHQGPRHDIRIPRLSTRFKWYLLTRWFSHYKSAPRGTGLEPDESDQGIWFLFRRRLAIRWLRNINHDCNMTDAADIELGETDRILSEHADNADGPNPLQAHSLTNTTERPTETSTQNPTAASPEANSDESAAMEGLLRRPRATSFPMSGADEQTRSRDSDDQQIGRENPIRSNTEET